MCLFLAFPILFSHGSRQNYSDRFLKDRTRLWEKEAEKDRRARYILLYKINILYNQGKFKLHFCRKIYLNIKMCLFDFAYDRLYLRNLQKNLLRELLFFVSDRSFSKDPIEVFNYKA